MSNDEPKVKLKLDDETRPTWEAVQRAKAEVADWPAWKRGEDPREAGLDTLEAELSDLRRENERMRAVIARLEAWTHEMGRALCPRGADTYGEGMRDAKDQVSRMLHISVKGKDT